eukprot:CAMPEP_0184700864 /NCGR_PEP_ID=MMETSP0313-20130426/16542_1 /TAXON_ID=2792 /ORGANISM="Porphyridium aerugineum, Strain SAG 1380-2" /LENGTH=220 /DNA_ID=CAMNT_0027160705 /DNA_START=545 /DNA_END=1207 /DNA_ORIENTATION=-
MAEMDIPRTSFLQRMIEVEIEGVDDMRRHQTGMHHLVEYSSCTNNPSNIQISSTSPMNQQHRYENEYWHIVKSGYTGVEPEPERQWCCDSTEKELQEQLQQREGQEQQHETLAINHFISSSSSSASSSFSSSSSIASTLSQPNAHPAPSPGCQTETHTLIRKSLPTSPSILEERIQSIRKALSEDELDSSDRKQMWEHLSRLEAAKSRRDELVRRRTVPS